MKILNYALSIIKNPAGTFHFVGSVPTALAYVNKDGSAVEANEVIRQMRLPASYRSFKTLTFSTKEAAELALKIYQEAQ